MIKGESIIVNFGMIKFWKWLSKFYTKKKKFTFSKLSWFHFLFICFYEKIGRDDKNSYRA